MIDAAWAAIIVTIVMALIAAFVGLWKHSEGVRDYAEQLNTALHLRITGLRSDLEQRFHNTDQSHRQERHKMVDDFHGADARLQEEVHDLELRIAALEHTVGDRNG